MFRKGLLTALVMVVFVSSAGAQFLAADLIYVPGVARTAGAFDARWRSDLVITNVEEEASIDIALVFIQTGLISNANAFTDRSLWAGGREADGFGFVEPTLADIPAGGTVIIEDPIGQFWGGDDTTNLSGAIVVFAYEANTLEDDGTRTLRNAIVNSRVWTPITFYRPDAVDEDEFNQFEGTFGQTLPGVPWYNLADPSAVDENVNYSFQVLNGASQSEDFRYNVGILNASDPLTSITVLVQPFNGDGEPFLDINGNEVFDVIGMPPSSHVQYDNVMLTLFGFAAVPADTRLDISVVQWSSGNSLPVVGMTTYGNFIDNSTNDPTAILPAFAYPYDVDCIWDFSDEKSGRVSRRPVDIPPRKAEN
ncbi:MAG: hypothetical protein PVG92_03020 [Holophagae bacterium]|jgi:hypothetical protein